MRPLDAMKLNMKPDLDKLRKFSLLAAVLLFSYSVAGIRLAEGEKVTLLGFPFSVSNPELLPLGLVALSLYGLVRFYYYGAMLYSTPYRIRRDLLKVLHAEGGKGNYKGSVFFGPTLFSTTPLVNDRADAKAQLDQIVEAFPMLWGKRTEGKIERHRLYDDEGDERDCWEAQISIPVICRIAASVQDIDYMAPIWANVIALSITGLRAAT